MRIAVTFGLVVIVLAVGAFTFSQTEAKDRTKAPEKEEKGETPLAADQVRKAPQEKSAVGLTSRAILARLQSEVETEVFKDRIKFKVYLDILTDKLDARDRSVTIEVDVEAFQQNVGRDAPNPLEEEVAFTGNRKRARVIDLLSQAVKQVGGSAAFIIRAGRVDIVPLVHTSKEYLFNQTVRVDFKDQRLDAALEEISDLTGVSIVIDPRAKEKVKVPVTARFNDDVAMQDAVRMLTDMAELKIVYLVTGMYITTPDHAKVMQKELKDLYEPKSPAGIFGWPDRPQLGGPEPSESPLAPPLPPPGLRGGKRLEAAA